MSSANVCLWLNLLMYKVEFPDGEIRPYATNVIADTTWSLKSIQKDNTMLYTCWQLIITLQVVLLFWRKTNIVLWKVKELSIDQQQVSRFYVYWKIEENSGSPEIFSKIKSCWMCWVHKKRNIDTQPTLCW